ncbi:ATP-dependent DNA ligase [Streptomyces laculatispora]|uniref:ATP-dependent DNA ligase n=1 Tax=Streptomyces laculatispora TaxID=887464 RepID=UPI001A93DBF6|nr:hypothetical protein [Streptomyces laculatispora]MBO0913271.1 hypothetical protein [Streptomyces laculatispora]
MDFPIKAALARAVPTLPAGPGWWFEPKFDGHRTVLVRTEESVTLYARSGRVVTQHWMDLAVVAMQLWPGTALDGEAVIWRDGRLDFGAAQSRAASGPARARALAIRHPASYAVWDLLQHPDPAIGDCRALPYTERRAHLLDVLADVGPPIQPVPATDDRGTALHWYEVLQGQGIEGVIAKRATAGYPSGRRGWVKIRHTETEDALVVGYTGPPLRPHRLALLVGDEGGPAQLSARLEPVLAGRIGAALTSAFVTGERHIHGGTYHHIDTDLIVEVLAGSGRHGTLTVTRMR